MKNKLRVDLLLLVILVSSVSACKTITSAGNSKLFIKRGIVQNMTAETITNLQLLHLPSRAVVTISPVLPHQQAEIGFRPTELKAISAELQWVQKRHVFRKKIDIPQWQDVHSDAYYSLVYRIHAGGEVTVHLITGYGI